MNEGEPNEEQSNKDVNALRRITTTHKAQMILFAVIFIIKMFSPQNGASSSRKHTLKVGTLIG